jgi:hypothetical protein
MAKKHKHEEHVNHERWVISFADMMTLLFALFVVLYALGQQDLAKAKQLKNSIQWAFHIAGEGKTKDIGIFDQQKGGGDVIDAAPLLNAQNGEMREFLKEVLPEYEEVAGKSPKIVQTDDSLSMTAPLSDFFDADRAYPIKPDIQAWLDRALVASLTFTSDINLYIETPDLPIGANSQGKTITSVDLCNKRLETLRRVVLNRPEILDHMVETRFRTMKDAPGANRRNWEETAIVRIAFSNPRPENR